MAKNRFLRAFGSLKIAVFSILTLAAVLATATAVESMFGMRAAYVMIYGRIWFAAVLSLLAMNVLCAALVRYPWKKRQTGFVITHLGILVLLGGSAVTQKFGLDGSLPVLQGSNGNEVLLPSPVLRFSESGAGKIVDVTVPESATLAQGELARIRIDGTDEVVLDEFRPRVRPERKFLPSAYPGTGATALAVSLRNSRFDVNEWLVVGEDGARSLLAQQTVGPALLTLRRLSSEAEEKAFLRGDDRRWDKSGKGTVSITYEGRTHRVIVDEAVNGFAKVGDSGLSLHVLRYLPYAVVENKKLVTRSQEPTNPALEIELKDVSGRSERHTVFALFPEFSTLHRAHLPEGASPMQLTFRYEHSKASKSAPAVRGQLDFAVRGERVLYRVAATARPEKLATGVVVIGKATPTGWMDLEFLVEEMVPYATETIEPKYVHYQPAGENALGSAVHLRVESKGKPTGYGAWLSEGDVRQVPIGGRTVLVQYARRRYPLPFQLQLEQFRIANDPGTQKAASYESSVNVLEGDAAVVTASAVIKMNEPLHHGGYTFYQASYSLEAGRPPVSVFSVNWDPGRWIKYLGSLLIVLGAALMFYMNPQYWEKLFGKKGS